MSADRVLWRNARLVTLAGEYIDALCAWLPALHEQGLVDAVDMFRERIGCTLAQTRFVFEAARALGLVDRGTLSAGQRANFRVWDGSRAGTSRATTAGQPRERMPYSWRWAGAAT